MCSVEIGKNAKHGGISITRRFFREGGNKKRIDRDGNLVGLLLPLGYIIGQDLWCKFTLRSDSVTVHVEYDRDGCEDGGNTPDQSAGPVDAKRIELRTRVY